jgi:hypothetical protein
LIGAREATFFGGLLVSLVTLATVWRVPKIARYRWDEIKDEGTEEMLTKQQ